MSQSKIKSITVVARCPKGVRLCEVRNVVSVVFFLFSLFLGGSRTVAPNTTDGGLVVVATVGEKEDRVRVEVTRFLVLIRSPQTRKDNNLVKCQV